MIDGAGSGFVIGGSSQVASNTIDHNIILNSTGLPNAGLPQGVGLSTCCGLGSGNTFTDNVVYDNPGGIANATGIAVSANTTTAPQLASPSSHDYRTTARTPDAISGWNLWDGGSDTPSVPAAAAAHAQAKPSVIHRQRAAKHHAKKRRHHHRRTPAWRRSTAR